MDIFRNKSAYVYRNSPKTDISWDQTVNVHPTQDELCCEER